MTLVNLETGRSVHVLLAPGFEYVVRTRWEFVGGTIGFVEELVATAEMWVRGALLRMFEVH